MFIGIGRLRPGGDGEPDSRGNFPYEQDSTVSFEANPERDGRWRQNYANHRWYEDQDSHYNRGRGSGRIMTPGDDVTSPSIIG